MHRQRGDGRDRRRTAQGRSVCAAGTRRVSGSPPVISRRQCTDNAGVRLSIIEYHRDGPPPIGPEVPPLRLSLHAGVEVKRLHGADRREQRRGRDAHVAPVGRDHGRGRHVRAGGQRGDDRLITDRALHREGEKAGGVHSARQIVQRIGAAGDGERLLRVGIVDRRQLLADIGIRRRDGHLRIARHRHRRADGLSKNRLIDAGHGLGRVGNLSIGKRLVPAPVLQREFNHRILFAQREFACAFASPSSSRNACRPRRSLFRQSACPTRGGATFDICPGILA